MALIVADRVQETTNSTGTGAYTLGGAVAGFQTFASAVSNADTVYYSVTDNADYEVGLGTYASSGGTITRTSVFASSNSNNAVNWGIGTKNIFLTYPADKAVIEDASNNVTIGNNLVVGGTVDGRDVAADGTKLDFITVTQAVDLDQMETDIAALENGMVYKGDWNAGSGSFPGGGSAQTGWFYYVSGAGTVNGISFAVGDNIVATTDNASTSTYASNWSKHDQTDAVQAVVGLTGSISKSSLLSALNVEDGADVTDSGNVNPLIDSHINVSGASSGNYLGWNGSDYAWSAVDLSSKLSLSGGTMSGDIDGNGNKMLFANMYSNLVDLPSATTYHGMFAHVHATGKAYFAHSGAWVPLANESTTLALSGGAMTGAITTNSTFDGRDVATDGTKLDGIESGADQTDTANVTAAGALMDSEVDADLKTFSLPANTTISAYGKTLVDDADAAAARTTLGLGTAATTAASEYATAAQGTKADAALPKAGGALTGAVTTNSTFDGRDVATDGAKLDGIEASADVTDTANVTSAGALMDSELADLAAVKAINQSLVTTASPTFAALTANGNITVTGTVDGRDVATDGAKLDGIESGATADQTITAGDGLSGGGTGNVTLSHSDTSSQGSVNNSGRTYIQDITLDTYGHITGLSSATETVTDTTYSAGSGLDLSGTTFSIESDLRGEAWVIGRDNNDYINVDTTQIDFVLDGAVDMRLYNNGNLHVEGNVVAYSTSISDERLKKDIVKIDNALDKVSQLNGYTFEYLADGKKSAGVIAQEVEKVMPSAITESTLPLKMGEDDETEYKTVQYDQLHGLMIEAIKELKAEIEELKAR